MKPFTCSPNLAAHIELRLPIAGERTPLLLALGLTVVTNRICLVGLVKCLEPEQVDAPVEQAADSGLPVCLHVVVAGFGGAGVAATCAWPAGFCGLIC